MAVDLELPKLADTRSTQRMLNMLSQLEEYMANRAAVVVSEATPVSDMRVEGEISRLRRENKALKQSLKQAMARIDAVVANLEAAPCEAVAESMAA
jgi:hypothetical protein